MRQKLVKIVLIVMMVIVLRLYHRPLHLNHLDQHTHFVEMVFVIIQGGFLLILKIVVLAQQIVEYVRHHRHRQFAVMVFVRLLFLTIIGPVVGVLIILVMILVIAKYVLALKIVDLHLPFVFLYSNRPHRFHHHHLLQNHYHHLFFLA